MYGVHDQTKAQIWVPKVDEGVREDALRNLLEPLGLSMEFFRPVYTSLGDDIKYASDQYWGGGEIAAVAAAGKLPRLCASAACARGP